MIEVKQGIYNNKTVTTMSDTAERPSQAREQLSNERYHMAIQHMILLRTMGEIDNPEVKRLHSLLMSPDSENWHIAERAIYQKLQP